MMLSPNERETLSEQLQPQLRTMQIIVGGLTAGLVSFAVIVVVVLQPEASDEGLGLVTLVSGGLAVALIAARFVVPMAVVRAGVEQLAKSIPEVPPAEVRLEDAKSLGAVYQTFLIIGAALLEGAAFLNLTAYMLEGHLLSLAVAAILTAGVLAHMPTTGRLMNWLERQLEEIETMRGKPLP